MTVHLTQPISLVGDWEYQFFDVTHQHVLGLFEHKVYLLSLEDVNPTPIEFFHLPSLNISSKILSLKLSLNKELLSIQVSTTTIVIFDTQSDKKWKIDIRGNKILEKGIIWSDHGGNSEDLVIITNKGLELYKINNRKGYCKLSRHLPQPVLNYWYNVETRMILLATSRKLMNGSTEFGSSSSGSHSSRKELLFMDGYFLKSEKLNIPMLELPPPDKIPRFELGPGVEMHSIYLVNVYGKLLTLVRYCMENEGYFAVYQISKSSVDKLFSLALGNMSTDVIVSTHDNLILCHDLKLKLSTVFDVQKTPRDRISRAGPSIIDPIIPPQVICQTSRFIEEEVAILEVKKRTISSSSMDQESSAHQPNELLANEAFGLPELKRAKSIKFLNSTEDLGEFNESNLDSIRRNVDLKSLRFDYVEVEIPRPAYPFYAPEVFDWYDPSLAFDTSNQVLWRVECKIDSTAKAMEDYREKMLFLQRRGRKYYYLKQQMQRGLCSTISQESQGAKIALLRIFSEAIEEKIDFSYYPSLFYGMMNSYVLESYRFLAWKGLKTFTMEEIDADVADYFHLKYLISTDAFYSFNSSNVGNNSNGSSFNSGGNTIPAGGGSGRGYENGNVASMMKPIVPNVRRQSIGEKVFQRVINRNRGGAGGGGGVNGGLDSLLAADLDSPSEIEPLEPNDPTIPPSISSTIHLICSRMKLTSQRTENLNSKSPPPSPLEKQFSSIRLDPYPLNTRRDEKGDLIITQMEVLMYIWIPLLLTLKSIDYHYCTEVLTQYLCTLLDQGVQIIPSLSYLHLQLVFALGQYRELLNFFAMNFYPNAIYIARSLLDFATLLREEISSSHESHSLDSLTKNTNDRLKFLGNCIEQFREFAFSMLWKLGEYTVIAKTYLLEGMILEAIEVCQQYLRYPPITANGYASSITFSEDSLANRVNQITNIITGSEFLIATLQIFEEEQRLTTAQKETTTVKSQEEKIRLLYAVYSFICIWDKSLIERVGDKTSRITQFAPSFPENLFDVETTLQFKQLFGYILS